MKSGSWELGPVSAISIMRGEQEACSPQTLPYKLAHGISSWALTTGSAGSPLDLNPGKGLLIRQGHLDVVTHVMQVS